MVQSRCRHLEFPGILGLAWHFDPSKMLIGSDYDVYVTMFYAILLVVVAYHGSVLNRNGVGVH